MNNDTSIEINGKKYVLDGSNPSIKTDHIIVIAQRGWIFEGYKDKSKDKEIVLLRANVVRKWSNGKGIGGLVESKDGYTLDPVGTVRFAPEAIIAIIDIKW